MSFPCTSCGACCRLVGLAIANPDREGLDPVTVEALDAFPYQARADGSCEKLDGTRCTVYEDRPLLCRVDAMLARRGTPTAEGYQASAEACHALQDALGLGEAFRVVLP